MKLIMYGTNACPDCVHAEEVLKTRIFLISIWTGQTVPQI